MKLQQLFEAGKVHKVSTNTLTPSKKKDQVTDFRNVYFDPANPYHADEKKRRDAEKAKQPKYTPSELKKKAQEIVKAIHKEAEKYDEIGAVDLIDSFVDHRKDPTLWDEVMDMLMFKEGVADKNYQHSAMVDWLTSARDFPLTNKSARKQSTRDIKNKMQNEMEGFTKDDFIKLNDFLAHNQDKWQALTRALDYRKIKTPPAGVPKDVFKTFVALFLEI